MVKTCCRLHSCCVPSQHYQWHRWCVGCVASVSVTSQEITALLPGKICLVSWYILLTLMVSVNDYQCLTSLYLTLFMYIKLGLDFYYFTRSSLFTEFSHGMLFYNIFQLCMCFFHVTLLFPAFWIELSEADRERGLK